MEISPEPSKKAAYKREITEGVKIFEESFNGLQKTKFRPKRVEYEKSIDMSLKALHDIAQAMVNKKLMKMKDQLDTDYHQYLDNPTDENRLKVQKDIESFKKE